MKSTMSFVLKLVGLVMALTGLVCLVVYYWESIVSCVSSLARKSGGHEDFDDDLLYDFEAAEE